MDPEKAKELKDQTITLTYKTSPDMKPLEKPLTSDELMKQTY